MGQVRRIERPRIRSIELTPGSAGHPRRRQIAHIQSTEPTLPRRIFRHRRGGAVLSREGAVLDHESTPTYSELLLPELRGRHGVAILPDAVDKSHGDHRHRIVGHGVAGIDQGHERGIDQGQRYVR